MLGDFMACSKIDPSLHQLKKPDWIRVRLPSNPVFFSTKALVSDLKLHTVCEEAQCPNRWECWSQGPREILEEACYKTTRGNDLNIAYA